MSDIKNEIIDEVTNKDSDNTDKATFGIKCNMLLEKKDVYDIYDFAEVIADQNNYYVLCHKTSGWEEPVTTEVTFYNKFKNVMKHIKFNYDDNTEITCMYSYDSTTIKIIAHCKKNTESHVTEFYVLNVSDEDKKVFTTHADENGYVNTNKA